MSVAQYRLKDFRWGSHDLVLWLLAEVGQRLYVLDVGTADGSLTRHMAQQGHRVVGVELDPAAAALARAYCDEFYCGDIEKLDLPPGQPFDCIVLADVLEHLRDPDAVLRRLRTRLVPGGCVIVSVPNVAHLAMRLSLLVGRFEYADRGILDRGHLRFFTLRSLVRTLNDCGFSPSRILATPAPIQLVWPFTRGRAFDVLHWIHFLVANRWKTLFGYQFVMIARARASSEKPPAGLGGASGSTP